METEGDLMPFFSYEVDLHMAYGSSSASEALHPCRSKGLIGHVWAVDTGQSMYEMVLGSSFLM